MMFIWSFGSKMVHSPRSPFGRIGRDVRSRFKNAAVAQLQQSSPGPEILLNSRRGLGLDLF